ncbi:2OG-Fe dioxygenase family protein [Sphingomonas sp. ERG5]|uniref:2OG-Fe dioxygenase family protein n=1 Tax=Sphingomonas sp. ERG5 TaxID=1381597 RepID=UPI002E162CBB
MPRQSMNIGSAADPLLALELAAQGFVRPAPDAIDWLPTPALDSDWKSFADSWNRLGLDRYMADGGRYRRRRHAAVAITPDAIARKPHQPHFQSRDYNQLNGDVQRWFEPMEDAIADSPMMQRLLRGATLCFEGAGESAMAAHWHVELHQFRIETTAQNLGRPTPEGMHRDGVDWVLVMLIDRLNANEGVTEIQIAGRPEIDRFTLAAPGDAVLLDDHRVLHGVTPIRPIDPDMPAHRDVFVATWKAEGSG